MTTEQKEAAPTGHGRGKHRAHQPYLPGVGAARCELNKRIKPDDEERRFAAFVFRRYEGTASAEDIAEAWEEFTSFDPRDQ